MVIFFAHSLALERSDPHELAPGFEVCQYCQMKGTHMDNMQQKADSMQYCSKVYNELCRRASSKVETG